MKQEYDLSIVHSELLDMMKDIHRICKKYGIEYSLTGGTLLGAVREAGFIPWDDDVDIMVDRRNYSRLCKAIKNDDMYEMGRGPWLQHIKPLNYNSEIIPFIDVFIMDNLPNNRAKASLKIFLLRIIQGMLKEEIGYKGFSSIYKACIFITNLVGKPFTRSFKLRLYDKVSQIGNRSTTSYISITNDSFGLLSIKHNSNVMKCFEELNFEDSRFMVTHYYSDYLSIRYGKDYMIPPAESERIAGQHANRPKVKNESVGV